jgi:lipopolysaccharide transport system ATP-binding protein
MSEPVIRVAGLSKRYRLRHEQPERYTALRDVVSQRLRAIGNLVRRRDVSAGGAGQRTAGEDFWALRGVSFEVRQGERIGVIGRNGAGKSTLLKILSRITEPTAGRVEIEGRVASLLEVGTGFHPELTGRENIFLNGAILGMGREETRRKFDEIVAFAEVERFLDTPVKRYSTGMYLRLAFAVAAHLEPEILVVDEVLAVGDAEFQKKCLGKMEAAGREGRTVLFVSHNMGAVLNLCDRVLLLRGGLLSADGDASAVVEAYLGSAPNRDERANLAGLPRSGPCRLKARLRGARLASQVATGPWQVPFGSPIAFGVEVGVSERLPWLEPGLALKSGTGFEIVSTLGLNHLPRDPVEPGEYEYLFDYGGLCLAPGIYRVGLGLTSERGQEDYLPEAFDFEVLVSERSAKVGAHRVRGALIPDVAITVRRAG